MVSKKLTLKGKVNIEKVGYTLTFDGGEEKRYTYVPDTGSVECLMEFKPTRTDFAKQGRCIDREEGLDCGCLICGRD